MKLLPLLLAVALPLTAAPLSEEKLTEKLQPKFARQIEQQSVLIEWDAVPESNIVGYNLYWGSSSRTYDHKQFLDKSTSVEVERIGTGKAYYFSVTAVNDLGEEGELSEEVRFIGGFITRVEQLPGKTRLTIVGEPDWAVNIAVSKDGRKWLLLKTVKNKSTEYKLEVPNTKQPRKKFLMLKSE